MNIQYDMTAESEIKFISTIGSLGQDRLIVNIPKKYHRMVQRLKGKDVIVTIREAIE